MKKQLLKGEEYILSKHFPQATYAQFPGPLLSSLASSLKLAFTTPSFMNSIVIESLIIFIYISGIKLFKKILRIKFALIITILVLLISGINFTILYLFVPVGLKEDKTVIIKSKLSVEQITSILQENKIIKYPTLLTLLAKLYSVKHVLKSGEYTFTQNISPIQTLRILASGKSVIHKLIIPEGIIVSEIIKKINAEGRLIGEISGVIPEGFLMPSTYYYSYGDQKEQIINKMRRFMSLTIDKAIQQLSPDSPLKTRLDVLILASIVEKETSLDSEKPLVAAVFLNRLKKQMKLQADPTTIYALTLGQGKLGRPLTKRDLTLPSPYNTYYVFNLPPGAISCPGAKSIDSVVNPANVDFLYFVVNSEGGHNFSSNISQHNKHVESYRSNLNSRKNKP